jgi:RimJ/RimL family protein N-acetyltransferase
MLIQQIETQRLVLREYRQEDWLAVHEYNQNPEVTRYMTWGPNSEEQTQEFVRQAIDSQKPAPRYYYELAVETKDTGEIIGGVGLTLRSVIKRTADIHYCFNPRFWGRGYGTEAVQAMLKLGFEVLELHRVWATCDTENKGSEAIMRKNGMRREAHYRLDELIKGEFRDSYLYAILADEWHAQATHAGILVRLSEANQVGL